MSKDQPFAALSVGSLGGTGANASMGLSLDFSGNHKLLSSSDFMKVTDDVAVRLAGIDDVKRSNELLSSDFAELRASHPEALKEFLQTHRGDELDVYNFDDPEAAARLAAEEERRLEEERVRFIEEQERQKAEALAAELQKLALIRRQQEVQAQAQAAPQYNPFVAAYPPQMPAPMAAPLAQPQAPAAASAPQDPTPAQLIGMLTNLKMKQRDKLEEIRGVQKRLLAVPVQEVFNALLAQQNELRTRLEHELATLDRLLQGVLLSYLDVLRVFSLRNDLRVQKLQLELFFQELQLVNQNPRSPVAALAILDQPFPTVVLRQKPLEEPVVVQMLTAASVQVQSVSPMRAVITTSTAENFRVAMDSHANPIEPEMQAIDLEKRTARWHLKPINGSRKNFVYGRFAMQVLVTTGGTVSHTVILESPPSAPFVVITNEVQWDETEAALILHYAFQDQLDVPWLLLANVLQRHFVRGTRQNVMNPPRPLSTNELIFIHRHFFGGGLMASRQQFTDFWAWFGKGVQRLRTTRPLGAMWGAGLLWCFIATQDAVNLLEAEAPGTFIVRLPEEHPGQFSIMYRAREPLEPGHNVGEVLVPPEALGPQHSLPELLVAQPQLELILQVTAMTQASTTTPVAVPYQFRRVPRTLALSSFLATGRKARQQQQAEAPTPAPAAAHGRSFLRTSNASDLTFVAGGAAFEEEVPPDA